MNIVFWSDFDINIFISLILNELMKNKLVEKLNSSMQFLVWIFALILGFCLGSLNVEILNKIFNLIALVFARLFQCLAIPVIALAVITALSRFNEEKNTGKIFKHAIFYTLLTTFITDFVGLILYILFTPNNIMVNTVNNSAVATSSTTYSEHLLSIIPNNLLQSKNY